MSKNNKHSTLVNIIDKRLRNNTFRNKRFYNSIAKNVEYGFYNGCVTGEIDNFAVKHGRKHTYILFFEDKSSPYKNHQAKKQLTREEQYLHSKKYGENFRIWKFIVTGYPRDKTWLKYKIKRV